MAPPSGENNSGDEVPKPKRKPPATSPPPASKEPSRQTPVPKKVAKDPAPTPVTRPAAKSPSSPAKPENPVRKKAAAGESGNPFGSTTPSKELRRVTQKRSNLPVWIGVAVVALLGVGAFAYFGMDFSSAPKAAKPTGTLYQNVGRNYTFTTPSAAWVMDEAKAHEENVDLAFFRKDAGAWIKVKSSQEKQAPSLGLLADKVLADWRDSAPKLDEEPPKEVSVSGLPAVRVNAVNSADGIALEANALANQGISYRLEFLSPSKNRSTLDVDFAAALKGFIVLGPKSATPSAPSDLPTSTSGAKSFRGKQVNYTVNTPAKGWRENPELLAGGRFADLKLVGPNRDVTFVVSVRPTQDVTGVEKLYLRRQEKLSEKVVVRTDRQELTIDGKPATRIEVVVTQVDGEYLLATTFLKSDSLVFQMEGRAPVDRVADYIPVFADIVSSFRLHDEALNPSRELADASKVIAPKQASNERTSPTTAGDNPQETPSVPKESMPAPPTEKGADAAAKPGPMKPAPPATGTKRRTLDDLD